MKVIGLIFFFFSSWSLEWHKKITWIYLAFAVIAKFEILHDEVQWCFTQAKTVLIFMFLNVWKSTSEVIFFLILLFTFFFFGLLYQTKSFCTRIELFTQFEIFYFFVDWQEKNLKPNM